MPDAKAAYELANNFSKSIMDKPIYDVKEKGYIIVGSDANTGQTTGFTADAPSYFTTSFDRNTAGITINHNNFTVDTTANELFINGTDLAVIKNKGGFTIGFDISTDMNLSGFDVVLYSIKGATVTERSRDNLTLRNMAPGSNYSYSKYFSSLLYPIDAEALRIYIKPQGYVSGTKITRINNYSVKPNYVSLSAPDRNAVRNMINDILKVSADWKNKYWGALGDSITYNNKYQPFVANELGIISLNYGVSSSTVAVNNAYTTGISFVERVTGIGNNDLWTIFGGVNDWLYNTPMGTISDSPTTSQNTFYGGLKFVVENILGRSNNPKLILFTPLQSNRNGANTGAPTHTMLDFCQAIKDVGQYYSVPVLDLYAIGGINPLNLNTYTSDGIHPNDAGTPIYAPKIIQAIRNLV